MPQQRGGHRSMVPARRYDALLLPGGVRAAA